MRKAGQVEAAEKIRQLAESREIEPNLKEGFTLVGFVQEFEREQKDLGKHISDTYGSTDGHTSYVRPDEKFMKNMKHALTFAMPFAASPGYPNPS